MLSCEDSERITAEAHAHLQECLTLTPSHTPQVTIANTDLHVVSVCLEVSVVGCVEEYGGRPLHSLTLGHWSPGRPTPVCGGAVCTHSRVAGEGVMI